MKPKLIVVGAAGRMGKRILALAVESEQFSVAAAVESKGHADLGKDAGLLAGIGAIDVKLDSVFEAGADVAIDFSMPEVTEKTIEYCLENGVALVLGTTGLSEQQRERIETASRRIPVIYGTNMGVGMNVLFSLVGKAAAMLGDEYDI